MFCSGSLRAGSENEEAEMSIQCPLCGGERSPGLATFTAELGFGVVVVRHVPATVCEQCGEEWIGDRVAEQLEAMVETARSSHASVAVTDWQERAA
jgi:YgiT-type zinc finger domain-containing protein